MENILKYIRNNWLILLSGAFLVGWFVYLTYSGNQFCDCAKTEKYLDGNSTRSHGRSYYRFYHK